MSAGASTRSETADAPGRFVIIVDGEWTPDQMQGLGKLMADYGKDVAGYPMTGLFAGGTLAEVLHKYNELKRSCGDVS